MRALLGTFAILGFVALMALPAFAADKAAASAGKAPPPDRAGLITAWEETTRKDAHVKRFEKTKEEGVYNFETDFFPYKGRLKLLNAVVTPMGESYTDFYRGIIELELLDAPEGFFKKYASSYAAWTQLNNFYYNPRKGVWFPSSEWSSYSSDYYNYGDSSSSSSSGECAKPSVWSRYGSSIISMGFFIAVIGGLLAFARRQNKRIWDNHAKALAEQQRGLKMVEESQKIAQESLGHQREHTQLLRDILAALKK
jgi:hypothetical protein